MVDALLKMDGEILLFIQDHIRQEWMDWFWKAVTHLGDGGVFWILLGIILLFSKKTRPAGVDHECLPEKFCGKDKTL